MSDFATRLIRWQRQHGRHSLPWQGADAYCVWLSEIMLQQTQVATVIPYYQRFVTSFPNIAALAAASEDKVLAHWSGLGYYSRARNLHHAAQIIMQQHGGVFPRNFDDILALPGIGRSTAAAICALALHERRAILDGNVKRVLARYCAIEGYTGERKIELQLWRQAEALLPMRDIAAYTQGLMDLGATVCTRTKPNCNACPVQENCAAYQSGRTAQLPTPRPRKTLPEKHSTFLLLLNGSDILLEKRSGSGIWGGLWCPPQFDDEQSALAWCMQRGLSTDKNTRRPRGVNFTSASADSELPTFGAGGKTRPKAAVSRDGHPANLTNQCGALPPFTHTFSHFKLHIAPLLVQVAHKPMQAQEPGRVWLDVEDALRAAIPSPVRKLIEKIVRDRTL